MKFSYRYISNWDTFHQNWVPLHVFPTPPSTECICIRLRANLQVVQQGAAQAHLPQRHVRVAGVEEALDLRADVQRQGLSPAHLHGAQRRARVVELLQAILRQHKHKGH